MIVLDGSIGRHLKKIGAPFGQPEWSALALLEDPKFITQAHNDFIHRVFTQYREKPLC